MGKLFEFKDEQIEVKCLKPLSDDDLIALKILTSMASFGIEQKKLTTLVKATIGKMMKETLIEKGLESFTREKKEAIPTNPFSRMKL